MTWGLFLFIMELGGLYATYLVGRRMAVGWLLQVFHNLPWFGYALYTGDITFALMPFLWIGMDLYNYFKWKKIIREGKEVQIDGV